MKKSKIKEKLQTLYIMRDKLELYLSSLNNCSFEEELEAYEALAILIWNIRECEKKLK